PSNGKQKSTTSHSDGNTFRRRNAVKGQAKARVVEEKSRLMFRFASFAARSRQGRVFFFALVVGALSSHLFAQTEGPSLQGRVLDPSNSAVAGAQVTAIPDGQTTGPSTVSDQMGEFTLSLNPGKYTIRINAKDFLEASQDVDIGNSSESRDFLLRLPGLQQSV